MYESFLKKAVENHHLIHASNLHSATTKNKKSPIPNEIAEQIVAEYKLFFEVNARIGYSNDLIEQRVNSLNRYYNFLHEQEYDNILSAQSKFRSSILEEFMYLLFRDYINDIQNKYGDEEHSIKCGSIKAYSNLFFTSTGIQQFTQGPQIKINQKDQDYAVYRPIKITTSDNANATINLPIIAIENKTYVDKTMLDSVIAAADKVKQGNPYTYFCIVTETYDVDFNVDPYYSNIDQIYVLRKTKRHKKDNNVSFQNIDKQVVLRLFNDISTHIEKPWSNVEAKMRTEGIII